MKNKVFLGGTCAGTIWREQLIPLLGVDSFNPVVKDWELENQIEESYQKDKLCNVHLYIITNTMQGVYSIAEVIDSVRMYNKVTILHILPNGFEPHQLKSLQATVDLMRNMGGIAYIDNDLLRTARVINYCFK
jgi:hypothetical protein